MNKNDFLMKRKMENVNVGVWVEFFFDGVSIRETDSYAEKRENPATVMAEIKNNDIDFYSLKKSYYDTTPREKYDENAMEIVEFKRIQKISLELKTHHHRTIFLFFGTIDFYLEIIIYLDCGKILHLKTFCFKVMKKLIEMSNEYNFDIIDSKNLSKISGYENEIELLDFLKQKDIKGRNFYGEKKSSN